MATIDIRAGEGAKITEIRFADKGFSCVTSPDIIELESNGEVLLTDSENGEGVTVVDLEHAENLIQALQKAIQLGWFV